MLSVQQSLDPRLVSISVQVGNNLNTYTTQTQFNAAGKVLSTTGLYMTATGTKFANSLQNECTVSIANLKQETRNFILTESSPQNQNRVPKKIIVKAGRLSTGMALLYEGEIISATPSQPPDIILTMKCLTLNFAKGDVIATSSPGEILLSTLSKQVAESMGLTLLFQAQDRKITSYSYSGSKAKQIDRLNEMGNISAYVDNTLLVVKNYSDPAKGHAVRILSENNGMIGIPEVDEFGIKVKMLLDNYTTLGSLIQLKSKSNPAANGTYVVYKLTFEISTRDNPYYWTVGAQKANGL